MDLLNNKEKKILEQYLDDVDPDELDFVGWQTGKWSRVHGNGKSSSGGKFHLEVIKGNDGKFKIRVVTDKQEPVLEVTDGSWTESTELKTMFMQLRSQFDEK